MKRLFLALCMALAIPAAAGASANPKAVAVLDTEAKWIKAIDARDAKALAKILSDTFVHINYQGAIRFKEQELALVKKPKTYQQNTEMQTVDFPAANVAVVHGVNLITAGHAVLMFLRYTDVYVYQAGRWQAVSAQETETKTNPESTQNK